MSIPSTSFSNGCDPSRNLHRRRWMIDRKQKVVATRTAHCCPGFAFIHSQEHNRSMAGDTVQQIKDKLSIADTVSQYLKLERAGSNMRARCPFHAEKTPSFFVSPERGTFHCFGCDKGGDIFT